MAEKQPLTAERLIAAQFHERFDREEIEELLSASGFKKTGTTDNWIFPGNTTIPRLYVPTDYPEMDSKTASRIGRAIQQSKPKQEAPSKDAPLWAEALVKDSDFKVERDGENIIFFAKDTPEYRFEFRATGNTSLDADTAKHMVATYNGNASDMPEGYINYKHKLDTLPAQGWKIERSNGATKLLSSLKGIEPIVLKGTPVELMKALEKADDAFVNKVIEQGEYIEALKKEGLFTTIETIAINPATGMGRITLRDDETEKKLFITTYGDPSYPYMDAAGEQELKAGVAEIRAHRKHKQASNKVRRIAESAVQAPEAGQAVFVLDTSAIIDLCHAAGNNGKSLIDMLKETARLKNVSKIIIPDYIADFEMQHVARHYDSHDVPHDSNSITPGDYANTRERFRKFINTAVRRHVNKDGKVEYLVNADVTPGNENNNIIIWETKHGRTMAEDIYALERAGRHDEIKRKYIKDQLASTVADGALDKGEYEIEALCNKELPWKVPAFVMTNDLSYLKNLRTQKKTGHHQTKTFVTAYEYIEAELAIRAAELQQILGLHSTNTEVIFKRINELSDGTSAVVRKNDTQSLRGGETLKEWIKSGLSKQPKEPAPVRPALGLSSTLVAATVPAVPFAVSTYVPRNALSPEAFAFGEFILHHMNECDLNRKLLAERIKALLPGDMEISVKDIRHILNGSQEVSDALLSVFMTALIDQNDTIPEEKKPEARAEMRRLHGAAKTQQKNMSESRPVDSEDYHAFGTYLEEQIGSRTHEALEAFATDVQNKIGALKPEEKKIDAALILKITKGEHVPSPGLAAAMRRALNDPKEFDTYYAAAKTPAKILTHPAKNGGADITVARQTIRGYFHHRDGTLLALDEIAEIGDIGKRRTIGSLLGKGGNVTFTAEELADYRVKLAAWVKKHAPQGREESFTQDWEEFSSLIIAQQSAKKHR